MVPSERAAKQNGWKHRLQNLFCCFAPQTNDQYYRPEPDSVVLKPPQPPAPPRHIGHAVLGPINEKVPHPPSHASFQIRSKSHFQLVVCLKALLLGWHSQSQLFGNTEGWGACRAAQA